MKNLREIIADYEEKAEYYKDKQNMVASSLETAYERIASELKTCEEYDVNKDKGFKIVCSNCGYEKCEQIADCDDGWDGEEEYIIDNGSYLYCPQCGQQER